MTKTVFVLTFVISACASVKSQKNTGSGGNPPAYKEELSSYRTKYETEEKKKDDTAKQQTPAVAPKNDITPYLKEKLDSVYAYNEHICCADGYRILVYSGGSREEADANRRRAAELVLDEKVYSEWKSPNFKVKVGDFVDKLEAYYSYSRLVTVFPNAILVPDKVNIIRE